MIKPSIVCLKPLAKTILCQSTSVQMLSNTCQMLLGSNYNQRLVTVLCTGVEISPSAQETEASGTAQFWKGYGRNLVPRGEIQKNTATAAKWSKILGQLRSPESNSQDIPSNSLLLPPSALFRPLRVGTEP